MSENFLMLIASLILMVFFYWRSCQNDDAIHYMVSRA